MGTRQLLFFVSIVLFVACKKENTNSEARLIFKFRFDSTQARLNNIGQPAPIESGNAAQSPVFNKMSAHYIELTSTALVPLGQGAVVYRATESSAGGAVAIDFSKASFAGNKEIFYSLPLKDVPKGDYEWIRISLAYQNADIYYRIDTTINGITINQDFKGTLAGFIGFNTYIQNFTIKEQTLPINGNRKQGFWGFETVVNVAGFTLPFVTSGQAPEGATTVVNPIFATSPIPQGSCVVTAAFKPGKLTITGNESRDIIIEASFSTNKSFEWQEVIADGKWEPSKGEKMVDMGIRGLIPTIK